MQGRKNKRNKTITVTTSVQLNIRNKTVQVDDKQPIASLDRLNSLTIPDNLNELEVIGADKETDIRNDAVDGDLMDKLSKFFEKFKEINSVILHFHFTNVEYQLLSGLLVSSTNIRVLKLNETKVELLNFSALATLEELAINSAQTYSKYHGNMRVLCSILKQNPDLIRLTLPTLLTNEYGDIIQDVARYRPAFELYTISNGEHLKKHLQFGDGKVDVTLNTFKDSLAVYALFDHQTFHTIRVKFNSFEAFTNLKPFFFEQMEATTVYITFERSLLFETPKKPLETIADYLHALARLVAEEQENGPSIADPQNPFALMFEEADNLTGLKWKTLTLQTIVEANNSMYNLVPIIHSFQIELIEFEKLVIVLVGNDDSLIEEYQKQCVSKQFLRNLRKIKVECIREDGVENQQQ